MKRPTSSSRAHTASIGPSRKGRKGPRGTRKIGDHDMNVVAAIAELTKFGKEHGAAPFAGKTLSKARGEFDTVICYFPDSAHEQAWIDRVDNGRKSSIGLNFMTNELTYGY